MTCAVCLAPSAAPDPRTAQMLCRQCAALPLRQLVRRLVWRATVDLGAGDRVRTGRVRAAKAIADAMARQAPSVRSDSLN